MNIDFYISSLSGGGAEKVLVTVAEELLLRGHKVSITSLEKRPQFYDIKNEILLRKINNTKKNFVMEILSDFKIIRNFLKSSKKSISISFLSRCNWLILLASLFLNKKIIVCDRNNPIKEHSKCFFYLSCILYCRATKIVVQTNKIKEMYPNFLQDKIIVIENPLNVSNLKKQVVTNTLERKNVIISMGRLEPQKDFVTLIEAFSDIKNEIEEWNLEIYGYGKDEKKLQTLIKELKIEDRVFLMGRTKTPFDVMSRSKIFVLSSFYEGFPNVLCEAMLAQQVCISSDCISGPSELITNEVNGYLFEIGNRVQLSEILNKCCNLSIEQAKYIGKQAGISVERLYLPKIVDIWESLIMQVKDE